MSNHPCPGQICRVQVDLVRRRPFDHHRLLSEGALVRYIGRSGGAYALVTALDGDVTATDNGDPLVAFIHMDDIRPISPLEALGLQSESG